MMLCFGLAWHGRAGVARTAHCRHSTLEPRVDLFNRSNCPLVIFVSISVGRDVRDDGKAVLHVVEHNQAIREHEYRFRYGQCILCG